MTWLLQEVIDEHRANLDRDNPKDLIDSYLLDLEADQDNPDSMLCGQFSRSYYTLLYIPMAMYKVRFFSICLENWDGSNGKKIY